MAIIYLISEISQISGGCIFCTLVAFFYALNYTFLSSQLEGEKVKQVENQDLSYFGSIYFISCINLKGGWFYSIDLSSII